MESNKFVHIFVDNDHGIFLQHRDDKPGIYDPNMLSAFGGHIEDEDAKPLNAAVRELEEETGLKVSNAELRGITRQRSTNLAGGAIRKVVYGFTVLIPSLDRLDCYEGQGAIFVPNGTNIDHLDYNATNVTRRELRRFFGIRFSFDEV